MSDIENKLEEPANPPPKRRWGKIILTLSLALNLLFIGAIVGAGWMRNKHHGGNWQGPPNFVLKRLLSDLPNEKRSSILNQVKHHRTAMRDRFQVMKLRKQDLNKALKNEPFNQEAVQNAATKLKQARHFIMDAKTELLVSVLGQLTPVERREILDSHLFRHLFGRRGRWGRQHH